MTQDEFDEVFGASDKITQAKYDGGIWGQPPLTSMIGKTLPPGLKFPDFSPPAPPPAPMVGDTPEGIVVKVPRDFIIANGVDYGQKLRELISLEIRRRVDAATVIESTADEDGGLTVHATIKLS